MAIMERDLPIADSIESGDYLRMVTSDGNSKRVLASEIGGGGLIVNVTDEGDIYIDKTYNEIVNAINNGIPVIFSLQYNSNTYYYFSLARRGMGACISNNEPPTPYYVIEIHPLSENTEYTSNIMLYATTADEQMTSTNPCDSSSAEESAS